MSKTDALLAAVKDILFREWDPIGVNDHPLCINEYDSYAPTICRMLRDGADEFKLTAHLRRLQADSIGMSHYNDELHQRVAKRLIALLG
jgi:hypothetical protein